MRIMIFFDLPTLTIEDNKNYRDFHQKLVKNGFIMTQYSVYSKLALNQTQANSIKEFLRKNIPKSGLVQCLEITERQFAKIEYMSGKSQTKIIDSDKRLIEL